MKAVSWTAYGPPAVLQIEEVETPAPGEAEILVKVAVSNIFPGDCELRRLDISFPFNLLIPLYSGLRKPKAGIRLGQEYSGEIVAIGNKVTRFKPGDRIFGSLEMLTRGSYAEYLTTAAKIATIVPPTLSFEQAAVATVGGLNALHFLDVAGIQEGAPAQKLLIIGAAGSIGTMAVQIAKAFRAHVTAVDTTHKLDALKRLGADEVIDFTREALTRHGDTYDTVIDIVGRNAPGNSMLRSLGVVGRGGLLVLGNPPFRHMLARLWAGNFSGRKVRFALAGYHSSQLERLRQLMADGRVTPLVDRRFPLTEVVAAHRYVESGARIGNVVLTMADNTSC